MTYLLLAIYMHKNKILNNKKLYGGAPCHKFHVTIKEMGDLKECKLYNRYAASHPDPA